MEEAVYTASLGNLCEQAILRRIPSLWALEPLGRRVLMAPGPSVTPEHIQLFALQQWRIFSGAVG